MQFPVPILRVHTISAAGTKCSLNDIEKAITHVLAFASEHLQYKFHKAELEPVQLLQQRHSSTITPCALLDGPSGTINLASIMLVVPLQSLIHIYS